MIENLLKNERTPMTVRSRRFGTLRWEWGKGFDDPIAQKRVDDVAPIAPDTRGNLGGNPYWSKRHAMACLWMIDPEAVVTENPPLSYLEFGTPEEILASVSPLVRKGDYYGPG